LAAGSMATQTAAKRHHHQTTQTPFTRYLLNDACILYLDKQKVSLGKGYGNRRTIGRLQLSIIILPTTILQKAHVIDVDIIPI
jgi:hypothetical protein